MGIVFDGDWSSEKPTGQPRLIHELVESDQPTGFIQPFMCPSSVYAKPTEAAVTNFQGLTWYFVKDRAFSDAGAGVWEYEREYVRKPDTITTYDSWSGTFPGLLGIRPPIPLTVTSEVVVEFFDDDPSTIAEIQGDVAEYAGGFTAPLFSGIFLRTSSTPSRETWQASIDAATAYQWIAEASMLSRFKGNIWQRTLRRVTAK